ncbi:MAG: hypothetical protein MHMPM18_000632 [Marteilia pararefringens]
MSVSIAMMYLFKYLADFLHFCAQIMLASRIYTNRSCSGISGKSVILLLITYCSRYLDMITDPLGLPFYTYFLKISYISIHSLLVYFIYYKFYATSSKLEDNANLLYFLVPAAIIGFIFTPNYQPVKVLEYFSLALEAIAMIPQLMLLKKVREAEAITTHYIFLSGFYRVLYTLYWILLYMLTSHLKVYKLACGFVQTFFYGAFFHVYFKSILHFRQNRLPTKINR